MTKLIVKPLLLLAMFAVAAACGDRPQQPAEPVDPVDPPDTGKLELTSFKFLKEANGFKLNSDIECTIEGDMITGNMSPLLSLTVKSLKPTFEGSFDEVLVGTQKQVSGVSSHDFTEHVVYTVKNDRGESRSYRVFVKSGSGLPTVRITTDGGQEVVSDESYLNGDVSITGIADFEGRFEDAVRVRVRGNATATYEKKPFRVRLGGGKVPLMGFPASDDWVLLAEYTDKSLLRTSYMFEISKIAGMEWTCRATHVELYLNGTHRGVYLFGENVGRGSGRVDIPSDGFIIENDNYWYQEPAWFQTATAGLYYTFKYPDPVAGDADYNYIRDFMNDFERALWSEEFTDPVKGYRKYIDPVNFARWYLAQEVLGNIDTNPYFVLPERGGKLKMYPLWDAEWSLGLAAGEAGVWTPRPAVSPVDKFYWKDKLYFARLISDPWFCNLLRSEWAAIKSRLPEYRANIKAIADNIKYAQADNFQRWTILGRYVSVGLVAFDTWEEEVAYAADFFEKRVRWFDTRVANLPN